MTGYGYSGRGIATRRRRYWRGRVSEWMAAAFLMSKGYRILARRERTTAGEIDLIATKRQRLIFVEVKWRSTLEDAEASVGARQRRRVRRAADLWLARHRRYQVHEIGFDLVFLLPGRWPVHIENGL